MTTTSRSQLLSTLWIFVLMNMIYADIIGMLRPGYLDLLDKLTRELTSTTVLIFAILVEVPILLILLSRILPRAANRAANFTAVPISIVYVIFGGLDDPPLSYLFFESVEILTMLVIFYIAWNWKAHSKQPTRYAAS